MPQHRFFGRFFLIFGLSLGPLVATDEAQSAPGNAPNLGICNGNSQSEVIDELCGSTEYPPWAPEYKHIPVNCSKDPSAIQTALKRSEQESHVILLVSGACEMDFYNRIADRVVLITGAEQPSIYSGECEQPEASIGNEYGYLSFEIQQFAQVTFRCLRLPAYTFFSLSNSDLSLDKLVNTPESPIYVYGTKQSRVSISPGLDCCTPPSFFANSITMDRGSYVSAFNVTMTNGSISLNDYSSGNFGLAGDVRYLQLANSDMYLGGGTGNFNPIPGFELSIDNLTMFWGSKAHITFRVFVENGYLERGSQLFAGRELIQNYTADETSYPPY